MPIDGWALFVTALGTVGTLILAITALAQGKRIRGQDALIHKQAERLERQIALGNRQAASAEASADAAKVLHREAMRSRVDQGAPEVAMFLEHPFPPLIDRHRSGMPQGGQVKLLDPESLERSRPAAGESFIFDAHRSNFLWFRGRGLLVNEGRTSARVRLSQEGRFVEGSTELSSGELVQLPVMEDMGGHPTAIMAPGSRALFEWAHGLTLGDWAQAQENRNSKTGSLWFWITVFDTREAGVVDTQLVHFRPEVLEAPSGRTGHWAVPDQHDFGPAYPLPRLRGYRHEGANHEDLSQRDEYLGQRDSC